MPSDIKNKFTIAGLIAAIFVGMIVYKQVMDKRIEERPKRDNQDDDYDVN